MYYYWTNRSEPMTLRIYPYKVGSKSVRALKDAITGSKSIKLENTRYRPRDTHTIINWGNSRTPSWLTNDVEILNHPQYVGVAGNKLETLKTLLEADVPTVEFTTERGDAEQWLAFGNKVYARTTLTGHSGEGIIVLQPSDITELDRIAGELSALGYDYEAGIISETINNQLPSVPDAPLYTRGVSNAGEYRVHVFNGEVILYQKKSRRIDEDGNVVTADGEEADVRNLASNWVYRTGNLRRLERIEELALSAIDALSLDFGAVDIIKDENGSVYVLEVNTAPGLGNTQTLEAYVDAINKLSE